MAANQFYAPLRNVKKSKKPVAGGLCKVYYAAVEDVALIPAVNPATAIIDDPAGIVLKAGKYWYVMGAHKKGYQTDHKEDDPGPYVETSVTPYVPFDEVTNHLTLDRMKYHRYILLVMMPDRTIRLVGSLDNPVKMGHGTQAGEKQTDSVSTTIRFTWRSEDLPLQYTGDITPVSAV